VREAVQTLAAKGFVIVRQGSGTTVAPRSNWNVLDPDYLKITGFGESLFENLLETREILEPAIAGLAAQRATEAQVIRLRELVDELAAVGEKSPTEHANLDIAFHGLLAQCTNNPILQSLHLSITHLGRAQRELMARHQGGVDRAVFWHRHIVDAVASRDTAGSQDAMRMHMRQVHSELELSVSLGNT
jgi:DNA-binding FadR family transcriptional regulator